MARRLSVKICIVFAVMLSVVHAFGSAVKTGYIEIEENQSGKFELLFWSNGGSYETELYVKETPEGMSVFIQPEKFILDGKAGSEYISLESGAVKAVPVSIVVAGGKGGEIVLAARTRSDAGGLSFVQERIFRLDARIGGVETSPEKTAVPVPDEENGQPEPADAGYDVVFLFLLILLASLAIYKFA